MDDVRARTETIVERLRSDPGFRRSVEGDPEGTLRAAGLPEELVGDFARGAGSSEVEAHLPSDICRWTCINGSSECTKSYLV